MATWAEMIGAPMDITAHDAPETATGVVFRQKCPTCKGNRVLKNGCMWTLCPQCDGVGIVEEVVGMRELARRLREEGRL